ncbi:MAG: hypothetical protein IPN77_12065 [Sandaracinaceae bacterium]|nr:hypothetical protein [Sandaracinaceae bacterium]
MGSGETVPNTTWPEWYERAVRQPYRSAVRDIVHEYEAYDIQTKTQEISVAILQRLREEYADSPIEFESISIGNIAYPDEINAEIQRKLAAEQDLERTAPRAPDRRAGSPDRGHQRAWPRCGSAHRQRDAHPALRAARDAGELHAAVAVSPRDGDRHAHERHGGVAGGAGVVALQRTGRAREAGAARARAREPRRAPSAPRPCRASRFRFGRRPARGRGACSPRTPRGPPGSTARRCGCCRPGPPRVRRDRGRRTSAPHRS